jgi:NAD(P)-dependent dehydrogenase (short-subunit alcohol dehydrogenase family)
MTQQRVALVTGVSSGIGRVTAEMLSRAGFRTFGTLRDMGKANEVPQGVEAVPADISDDQSVREVVQSVHERGGQIDLLVNSAGYTIFGAAEETSIEEARALFETNFFGVMRMCNEVLPIMRRQGSGRIVNIASVLGFLPAPYMAVYAASKHAIEGYSESLDHEVRQFNIRVSVVEPGFTNTKLGRNSLAVRNTMNAYAAERAAASQAIRHQVETGEDPMTIASAVLHAATTRSPNVRYAGGKGGKLLRRLRRFAPAAIVDRGLRRQFGLGA